MSVGWLACDRHLRPNLIKVIMVFRVITVGRLTLSMITLGCRDGGSPLRQGQGSPDGGEVFEHEVGL